MIGVKGKVKKASARVGGTSEIEKRVAEDILRFHRQEACLSDVYAYIRGVDPLKVFSVCCEVMKEEEE